jgi:hypothetical protein
MVHRNVGGSLACSFVRDWFVVLLVRLQVVPCATCAFLVYTMPCAFASGLCVVYTVLLMFASGVVRFVHGDTINKPNHLLAFVCFIGGGHSNGILSLPLFQR